jgi:CxxC motif-containing protein (DUF1111 family)
MRAAVVIAIVGALAAVGAASAAGGLDAVLGKALFERDWIAAPASTNSADGLGPLFGARSCAACHAGKTLAARFTAAGDGKMAGRGLVLRFGDADGRPDPVYGQLMQNRAIDGLAAEGRVVLSAPASAEGRYGVIVDLDRGPLDAATRMSFRAAPPLVGRAALDVIDADAVMALADPQDRDGDGVSGRPRMVFEGGLEMLGRYGWKAGNPSLAHQVADAFAAEIGLSSALRPHPYGDCTAREADCLAAPHGASPQNGGHELPAETVGLIAAFLRELPAAASASGVAGETVFASLGCARCHVPTLPDAGGRAIVAFTDLLLHDMGPGLDDGVGEPGAQSAEWRTAPLVGLAQAGGRRYLHDGRAASLDAAIRAHGGEADNARRAFASAAAEDRHALIDFLDGL